MQAPKRYLVGDGASVIVTDLYNTLDISVMERKCVISRYTRMESLMLRAVVLVTVEY